MSVDAAWGDLPSEPCRSLQCDAQVGGGTSGWLRASTVVDIPRFLKRPFQGVVATVAVLYNAFLQNAIVRNAICKTLFANAFI